jgi:CheY-like chemotaxis protein
MDGKKKILIVDDEPMNIDLLEAILLQEDYEIIAASNGAEAISATRSSPPDLILLDIMMPVMDGYTVAQELKSDPDTAHIPIILVTALNDVSDRVKGLKAGADDFLTKPVEKSELKARVNNLLKVKAYHDHMRNYQNKLEEEVSLRTQELEKELCRRKETEAQLIRAQKMEAIGTLAGGIAHDFNNILSAILGYSEMALLIAATDATLSDYIRQIHTAGERARDLVHQILTFSRETDDELKPAEISVIIKEALKLLGATLPSTITTEHDIATTSPVLANPTQIHQLLMNLCTNAAHAMEDKGGVLAVSLTDIELDAQALVGQTEMTAGNYVKLSVSDNGKGMSPDVLERIYDPFYTTKPTGKGTGLGLSTVHGIVKNHFGSIAVSSKPDAGTTFDIFLPIVDQEVVPEISGDDSILNGTESILFVDDDKAIAGMSKIMLENLGYHVNSKTSSIDALVDFKRQPEKYDLVITDLTMPQMTGLELADEILSVRPDTPIILCTGLSARQTSSDSRREGIQAVLAKPILSRTMSGTIRSVMKKNVSADCGMID